MSKQRPLIIVDEVLFPGVETEVDLSAEEQRNLRALTPQGDQLGPVILASRLPGSPRPTRMETRTTSDPDRLIGAAIMGMATLQSSDDPEGGAKLVVAENLRVRIRGAEQTEHGWLAGFEAWTLDMSEVTGERLTAAKEQFYRVLLGTRDVEARGRREQLETPISELESTEEARLRLWLLADYLFDDASLRTRIVTMSSGSEILESLEATLATYSEKVNLGAMRRSIAAYLAEASSDSVDGFDRLAQVVRVAAPMLDDSGTLSNECSRIADLLRDASKSLEKIAIKLNKRR